MEIDMRIVKRCWTPKYGDLSERPLDFGPEWKIEGAFQKFKCYITLLDGKQIICGLEVTLKDGTVSSFGYTDANFLKTYTEEIDLSGLELTRLGICVCEKSQLILAIQLNCVPKEGGKPTIFFIPDGQQDLPFKRDDQNGEFCHNGPMFFFGPLDQRRHYEMMQTIFFDNFDFAGIKGKTVMKDGKSFICELQVEYCKEEAEQERGVNEALEAQVIAMIVNAQG